MILEGARLFDGVKLHAGGSVHIKDGRISGLDFAKGIDLGGGYLCPGYVDLQVNGGGGVMLNEAPTAQTLATMSEAHAQLGATTLLPTLITAPLEVFQDTVNAFEEARKQGVRGLAGLHIEGPHITRAGAHDPSLLRPLSDVEISLYAHAARIVGHLKLTLAPELVRPDQIAALHAGGVQVFLGHTDAEYDNCCAASAAGAEGFTHLFNAMSGLSHRAPGCVGAALNDPTMSAGLIADGVHVHPDLLAMVWRAKAGEDRLFLVSDAMAVAGTLDQSFTLNGRTVLRRNGCLTLEDGTLAGADLDLSAAIRNMVRSGVPLSDAFAMATRVPADLIGRTDIGRIEVGARADLIHLSDDLELLGVWREGEQVL